MFINNSILNATLKKYHFYPQEFSPIFLIHVFQEACFSWKEKDEKGGFYGAYTMVFW